MPALTLTTPLGRLTVTEAEGAITSVTWRTGKPRADDWTALLTRASEQLRAYFASDLQSFDLPLAPQGDAFQRSVCRAMTAIPYGRTREYGQIACDLGSLPQPVGQACGRNSIPVIIPCHRVVGANGLGGFSAPGGVETKVALLRHEGAYSLLI